MRNSRSWKDCGSSVTACATNSASNTRGRAVIAIMSLRLLVKVACLWCLVEVEHLPPLRVQIIVARQFACAAAAAVAQGVPLYLIE